jgi:acyl-coenzyme A thioesterase PaaI-like protein
VAASAPSIDLAAAVSETLREAARQLRAAPAEPSGRWFGRLETPGRGQTMCPPLMIKEMTDKILTGSVTFTSFHGGFGDSVHGGAVALIMNEVMGTLANATPSIVRLAAYIHVNYRSGAPVGTELDARAEVTELKGRKQTIVASLRAGDRVIAESEGLFLLPAPAG